MPVVQLVPKATYILANFKETQMADMRPGQRATIRVASSAAASSKGKVESLSGGTGASFSLLPPDNASGSFVKVVQRVPVRISWTGPPADQVAVGSSGRTPHAVRWIPHSDMLTEPSSITSARERVFETLIENASDIISRFDRHHRHLYVNGAVARATGRPASDFIGKTHEELGIPPDLARFWIETQLGVFETGIEKTIEFSYPAPDGHMLWYRSRVVPELDENGAVQSVITIARDVTDAKAAEEARVDREKREALAQVVEELNAINAKLIQSEAALRKSESFFRALAEANLVGVGYGTVDGDASYVNDEMLRMMGRTRAEFATGSLRWPDCVAPEFRAEHETLGAALLREGRITGYEREFLRPDGTRTPYVGAAALVDDSGLHVSIAVDLTRLHESRAALRQRDDRIRTLVDGNIIGVITAGDSRVCDANQAFLDMVGYDREDLKAGAIPWLEMPPPEDPLGAASIATSPGDGKSLPFESELVRKDGSRVPILTGATLLSREPLQWVCFVLDLTEQKRIEAENQELFQSEKRLRALAEEASDSKDTLLAAVSHELRTPLTTISGWLQILEAGGEDADLQELAFRSLRTAVASQKRMVDDLIDVVRFSRGVVLLDSELIDLQQVVVSTAAALMPLATESGIDVRVEAGGPVSVNGDRSRLGQVVANLVSNALKFTERGGTVTVRVATEAETAVVQVIDTGCGIEPAFLPRVFEKFSQGQTQSRLGLGLGLSIVRSIIESHKGTVAAHSDGIGTGSRFTIRLPLAIR